MLWRHSVHHVAGQTAPPRKGKRDGNITQTDSWKDNLCCFPQAWQRCRRWRRRRSCMAAALGRLLLLPRPGKRHGNIAHRFMEGLCFPQAYHRVVGIQWYAPMGASLLALLAALQAASLDNDSSCLDNDSCCLHNGLLTDDRRPRSCKLTTSLPHGRLKTRRAAGSIWRRRARRPRSQTLQS